VADRYFQKWDEHTDVPWWNTGRAQLNAVIARVNDWTLDDCPRDAAGKLLRYIDMGMLTFAAIDGGSGWREVLVEMREYVEEERKRHVQIRED